MDDYRRLHDYKPNTEKRTAMKKGSVTAEHSDLVRRKLRNPWASERLWVAVAQFAKRERSTGPHQGTKGLIRTYIKAYTWQERGADVTVHCYRSRDMGDNDQFTLAELHERMVAEGILAAGVLDPDEAGSD
jgi:hypothetical protein